MLHPQARSLELLQDMRVKMRRNGSMHALRVFVPRIQDVQSSKGDGEPHAARHRGVLRVAVDLQGGRVDLVALAAAPGRRGDDFVVQNDEVPLVGRVAEARGEQRGKEVDRVLGCGWDRRELRCVGACNGAGEPCESFDHLGERLGGDEGGGGSAERGVVFHRLLEFRGERLVCESRPGAQSDPLVRVEQPI